jgi:PmbA protein
MELKEPMQGQDKLRELTSQILAMSKADQAEVLIDVTDSALTRFANSTIHQNVLESNIEVRVRVVYGKKTGVASSNDLSPDALKHTVDTARAIAQLQPDNPEFQSLPTPQPIQAERAQAFVERTANFLPEQRAQVVNVLCKKAKANGVTAAGAFSTSAAEVAVANSLGVFAYHAGTVAEINTVMISDTGSGYAAIAHPDAGKISADAIANEAIDKAMRARNPTELEPGEYTVLLEEYAVQDLLENLADGSFNAQAVQEEISFMRGKMGERVMSDGVTIWDDGLAADTIAMPFDYEGVPKHKVTFVENGIARAVVYDSMTAARDKVLSTGHSLPAPNSAGPQAMHMAMAPGDKSKQELIKSIERGVWVTRFWYTRIVHPLQVIVTGTTRDGTFLIENGEVTRPVRNFRFTTSYLDALNHVSGIGRETKLLYDDWEHTACRVPAIVVGKFNFTGTTQF